MIVPQPGEYVANGAARQAAWVLTGALPDWQAADRPAVFSAEATPQVLADYRARRGLYAERGHRPPTGSGTNSTLKARRR